MKSRRALLVMAAMALALWWVLQLGPFLPRRTPTVTNPGDASVSVANRHAIASEPSRSEAWSSGDRVVSYPAAIDSRIQELLGRPPAQLYSDLPRPGDVPQLDAATETELIRQLRIPDSPTNKLMVIYLLAIGGGPKAVTELPRFLTNDFSGRVLDKYEDGVLNCVIELLGVAARRHPETAQFLERSREPKYWRSVALWQVSDGTKSIVLRSLVATSITALAWSGRPEVDRMLNYYRDNPAPLAETGNEGSVPEAARIRALIAEVGFERAWELCRMADSDTMVREARKWGGTPEAREWWEWYLRATAATQKQDRVDQ